MSRLAASQRTRRVSSAAMTVALASSSARRRDASSARPIGTAASVSTPSSPCSPMGSILSSVQSAQRPFGSQGSSMWPMMGTETELSGTAASEQASRLSALRARLGTPMPDDRLWGWLGPGLVTAFGAWLRFDRLQVPRAVVFDETYYAKDAWSILQHGVEWNYVSNANTLMLQGHTASLFVPCSGTGCGEYVVQPEVGKLLIAVGEAMFGLDSYGWRFFSAVFGSLAILLVCRIARRMTRSTLLGCIAGLLMSLDGLEFVLSRTGILDVFLMFFVLAAFGCILIDQI